MDENLQTISVLKMKEKVEEDSAGSYLYVHKLNETHT